MKTINETGRVNCNDHGRASNDRYLNALAVVEDPTPAYQQVADLTESKVHQGRRYAGFNPGRKADIRLFRAVLSGEHELRGFRNSDIRHQLYSITRDKVQDRCQANAVSRQLRGLHVRSRIAKIPRTHRWRVTERERSYVSTTTAFLLQSERCAHGARI